MDHMHEVFMAMVIFGAIAYVITQYFNHRQRMKMIESGITKLEFSQTRSRSINSVKYGLVAIALGLAIFISQIMEDVGEFRNHEIGFALVPIFVGVALIVSAIIERKMAPRNGSDAIEMKQ